MDDITNNFETVEQIDEIPEDLSVEAPRPVAAAYAHSAKLGESSCERQICAAKAYAAAKGLELRSTYIDEGCSGIVIAGRDGLDRLLVDARKGSFQVLITEPDRLSRSMSSLLSIWEQLSAFGVRVHTPDGGQLTCAEIIVGAALGEAEAARKQFADRCEGGRRQAAAHGRLLSPVFGYRRDPDRRGEHIVDSDKAQIVQRIFARLDEGATPAVVARELAAAGATIKTASRVRAIARCSTYAGLVIWGRTTSTRDSRTGARVKRNEPRDRWVFSTRNDLAIVSREVWTRVGARLGVRSPR